jgi:hypothetical protein
MSRLDRAPRFETPPGGVPATIMGSRGGSAQILLYQSFNFSGSISVVQFLKFIL